MSSNIFQILSTLLFLYITLNSPVLVVGQDCPYPCYPPPIGGGNNGGGNNQPKTTFPPPSQTGYYPSPSSIFPYNPPNPNYYGNGPPSPDPIVPWFPFYYKKPPHNTDQPSSTSSQTRSTDVIFLIYPLVLSFLLLVG
ncbi:hypothetical protein R6Q59_012157 [Mikania micrantha]